MKTKYLGVVGLLSWMSWLIFTSAKCSSGSSGLLPALLPGSGLQLGCSSGHIPSIEARGQLFPGKGRSSPWWGLWENVPFPRKQQRGERAHSSSSQSESRILCELLSSQTLIVLLLLYCSSSEFLWEGLLWSRKAWSFCTTESKPWLRKEQQLQETFLTHHWIFQWVVFWQQHVLNHWRAPLQKHVDCFLRQKRKANIYFKVQVVLHS